MKKIQKNINLINEKQLSNFNAAVSLHKQGKLDMAANLYKKIIEVDPKKFRCPPFIGCISTSAW